MREWTDREGSEVVSIEYSNGLYTISVRDNKSGIWKITDSEGNEILDLEPSGS